MEEGRQGATDAAAFGRVGSLDKLLDNPQLQSHNPSFPCSPDSYITQKCKQLLLLN